MSKIKKMCLHHPEKQAVAGDLCGNCYGTARRRRLGVPIKVRRDSKTCPICTPGSVGVLCDSCYEKRRRGTPEYKELNYKRQIKYNFGVTVEDYAALLKKCGGVCSICEGPFVIGKIKRPCVDHNHKTGKVRGLLCHTCNAGLGKFKDDVIRMQMAVDYRESYPQ